mmetsp:Transcript_7100/g.20914  ORF Transcript_7100/g.20914 Transcript_7100/m.20914 type:complete len:221 (+) Transcript_7100:1325-1987(+)
MIRGRILLQRSSTLLGQNDHAILSVAGGDCRIVAVMILAFTGMGLVFLFMSGCNARGAPAPASNVCRVLALRSTSSSVPCSSLTFCACFLVVIMLAPAPFCRGLLPRWIVVKDPRAFFLVADVPQRLLHLLDGRAVRGHLVGDLVRQAPHLELAFGELGEKSTVRRLDAVHRLPHDPTLCLAAGRCDVRVLALLHTISEIDIASMVVRSRPSPQQNVVCI